MSDWRDYPCDEWPGAHTGKGYGYRQHEGRRQHAHRVEWILQRGPIPPGLYVLHHCDNRPCREIQHLFLGTAADNTADMIAKGRNFIKTGERNLNAKLTEEQVTEIRRRYHRGNGAALAREFGVGHTAVMRVVRGINWRRAA